MQTVRSPADFKATHTNDVAFDEELSHLELVLPPPCPLRPPVQRAKSRKEIKKKGKSSQLRQYTRVLIIIVATSIDRE